MTLGPKSTLQDVAVTVARALHKHRITAVLTGGACASIHADGLTTSFDVDFVLEHRTTGQALDRALASTGFVRERDRYVHPTCAFIVEFPAGPLGIGDDAEVVPAEITVGRTRILALSATDSCRDRLAAFYHWNDTQGLAAAIAIAVRRPVDMTLIETWSSAEGAAPGFAEFRSAVARAKRQKPSRRR